MVVEKSGFRCVRREDTYTRGTYDQNTNQVHHFPATPTHHTYRLVPRKNRNPNPHPPIYAIYATYAMYLFARLPRKAVDNATVVPV